MSDLPLPLRTAVGVIITPAGRIVGACNPIRTHDVVIPKQDVATALVRAANLAPALRACAEALGRIARFRPSGRECWCLGDELDDEPHDSACIAARAALTALRAADAECADRDKL